ncbi:MAG: GYF domain-containing protein [Pelagibaca sp.]
MGTARFFKLFAFGIFSALIIQVGSAQANSHLPPAPPPLVGATPPPPPPPITVREMKVFITANGAVNGPFNKAELEAKIASGELNRATLIWIEGMSDWAAAATVPTVAPLLVTAPPPATFDAQGFQVGTWETSGTGPLPDGSQAQFSENMTFRADGTISGFGSISSQQTYGPFVMNLSSTGTWKVQAKTENSYILSLNLTITGTSRVGPPSVEAASSSILLTVVDRNTVAGPDGHRRYRIGN